MYNYKYNFIYIRKHPANKSHIGGTAREMEEAVLGASGAISTLFLVIFLFMY